MDERKERCGHQFNSVISFNYSYTPYSAPLRLITCYTSLAAISSQDEPKLTAFLRDKPQCHPSCIERTKLFAPGDPPLQASGQHSTVDKPLHRSYEFPDTSAMVQYMSTI
jgi:hypothetical protein